MWNFFNMNTLYMYIIYDVFTACIHRQTTDTSELTLSQPINIYLAKIFDHNQMTSLQDG